MIGRLWLVLAVFPVLWAAVCLFSAPQGGSSSQQWGWLGIAFGPLIGWILLRYAVLFVLYGPPPWSAGKSVAK